MPLRVLALLAGFFLFFNQKLAAQESAPPEFEPIDWLREAVFWPRLDSIGNPDSLSEEQLRAWAARLDQQADILKTGFERELKYATYRRQSLHDELGRMKSGKTVSDSVMLFTTNNFLKSKQAERDWENLAARAQKVAKNTGRLEKMPVAGLRRAIPTNEADIRRLIDDGNAVSGNRPAPPSIAKPAEPTTSKPTEPAVSKPAEPMVSKPAEPIALTPVDSVSTKPAEPILKPETGKPAAKPARPRATRLASDYKKYSRADDPLFNPPVPKCRFSQAKRDEFTGQTRTEVAAEPFFTFTNSFMKSHLNNKPHIVCDVQLVGTSGGAKYVNLSVRINEGSAKRSFGGLNRGNHLTIKFIDGSTIQLENARSDEGAEHPTDNYTVFSGMFLLDGREQVAALKKLEIDRVRIGWNTGFEDYEVYNIDVLKRQANCLF